MAEALEKRQNHGHDAHERGDRQRIQRDKHTDPLARGRRGQPPHPRLDDIPPGAAATGPGQEGRKGHHGRLHQAPQPQGGRGGEDHQHVATYTVFNVAQMDGLPPAKAPEPRQIPPFIAATKADIRPGPQPMYVPAKDFIAMPPQADFRDEAHHTATALHELAHWSGAKHRLDRDMEGRFGTRKYAAEELVAELTSAFLCAHLGIKGELRHAGYIETWLELLRSDNRAMFTAASKASQAADYLRAFSETPENE
jgi:antirestriction protein ArdC